MVEAGSGAVPLLVAGLPHALWASWAMVVAATHTGPERLHVAGDAPDDEGLELPWMPIDRSRRLARAPWMPASWQVREDRCHGVSCSSCHCW